MQLMFIVIRNNNLFKIVRVQESVTKVKILVKLLQQYRGIRFIHVSLEICFSWVTIRGRPRVTYRLTLRYSRPNAHLVRV